MWSKSSSWGRRRHRSTCHRSTELVRPLPARPDGTGELRDLGVAPGYSQWLISRWAPHEQAASHHTDTLDYDLVLAGTMVITLGDGEHRLEAGDAVVVTGVDHAWRAGPEGCILSVVLFGTSPPAAETPTPT